MKESDKEINCMLKINNINCDKRVIKKLLFY